MNTVNQLSPICRVYALLIFLAEQAEKEIAATDAKVGTPPIAANPSKNTQSNYKSRKAKRLTKVS